MFSLCTCLLGFSIFREQYVADCSQYCFKNLLLLQLLAKNCVYKREACWDQKKGRQATGQQLKPGWWLSQHRQLYSPFMFTASTVFVHRCYVAYVYSVDIVFEPSLAKLLNTGCRAQQTTKSQELLLKSLHSVDCVVRQSVFTIFQSQISSHSSRCSSISRWSISNVLWFKEANELQRIAKWHQLINHNGPTVRGLAVYRCRSTQRSACVHAITAYLVWQRGSRADCILCID